MAKKAEATVRTLPPGDQSVRAVERRIPSYVDRLCAVLDQGFHPEAPDHPVASLLRLLADLRSIRLEHLSAQCHRLDGTLPSETDLRAAIREAMELDARLGVPDSNGLVCDGITELIRDARRRCGQSGLDPFQTTEVLKAAERLLRTLWNFSKLLQGVRGIRQGLANDPEVMDQEKMLGGDINWVLDNRAVGTFFGEIFDEPYENLLALWDNLVGRENADDRRDNDNAPGRSALSVLHAETAKGNDNPTKLPPEEAGRLAKRFTSASDDFPDLSALVWFNLTPSVRAGNGVHFDFTPPMFKVSGQRGEHRNYCWDREWWSVQFFTDIGDEGRFKLACMRFESMALKAGVPEVEGRPPAADARLLTFLSDADGVQKLGRHPTDPYFWADPSGKHLHQSCPDWDDPNAVLHPARPGLHGASVSAPMPSAEVMRNGFRPEWWCAHLPNVFQRAAEWLEKSKQSARIDERGTVRIQSEEQLGAGIIECPDALRQWAEDALTRLQPCPDCRTPADAQMVISAHRDFTAAATCRKCGRYKLITDHRMVVASGAGAIVAPTVLVRPGWGAGLRWIEVPTPPPSPTPAPNALTLKPNAQAGAAKRKAKDGKPKNVKGLNVDGRMRQKAAELGEVVVAGWTSRTWGLALGCSHTVVVNTPYWKNELAVYHANAKCEKTIRKSKRRNGRP